MLTGIGGQGVQLAAQVLARAAIREGRFAMLFGVYGGVMRGGNTDSTLVVADGPIAAPPILSRTGSAIAMHHQYFEPLRRKLRPSALLFLNAGLFEGEVERGAYRVVEVPATQLAAEVGSALAGSLVMAGAYAAYTGLVGLGSLVEGMRESLPPYRQQHAELNRKALELGFGAVPAGAAPVWQAAQ
jgi:Pyruvate/2-oxoacid:ferredoxin oxidoreductase gamma subunit